MSGTEVLPKCSGCRDRLILIEVVFSLCCSEVGDSCLEFPTSLPVRRFLAGQAESREIYIVPAPHSAEVSVICYN